MKMSVNTTENSKKHNPGNVGMQLILLMGLVSAMGDITYETGRSISGPYLAFLGASAAAVGFVSGFGEFLGYALRLASGYIADRTRAYWLSTFIGYGLILCVPLLAYTNRWEWAAVLLLAERVGKAIRSPARDTILSHATHQTGRGWGFAIHEALDQIGAVIGPVLFSAVFLVRNSYRDGFSILWIPAVLTVAALAAARLRVPEPEKLEVESYPPASEAQSSSKLPTVFWIYALFTFFGVAGFANFQIISFHLINQSILSTPSIPILYAVAMGIDAVAALAVGKLYDRIGLNSLAMIPFATLLLPFLAFSQQYFLVIAGAVVWGIVMAVHETTMRAAIADITPIANRGSAYGIFNTIYGAAWFVGAVVIGALYEASLPMVFVYILLAELGALAIYWVLRKRNQEALPVDDQTSGRR